MQPRIYSNTQRSVWWTNISYKFFSLLLLIGTTSRLLDGYSISSSNNHSRGHTTEKSMVDNSTHVFDIRSHLARVFDSRLEMKINNIVSVIGNGNVVPIALVTRAGSHTKDGLASLAGRERSDRSHGVLMAKRCNLHRDWETRSEGLCQLGFVD